MDPIGTLVLALGALVVLDLAAPHLAGDRRAARRRMVRRGSGRLIR